MPKLEKPTKHEQLSTKLDREAAARAYRKAMSGEKPTAEEKAALRRVEKEQEEKRRWEYYGSIPQKHWREMSGRQTKVLHEQAQRYGLPFGGRVVDLPLVVRSLHDFLATNARKLQAEPDDLMAGDVSSPALERYREERAKLARLERLERERQLIPRSDVRDGLGRISALIRAVGETLERECGAGALDILNDGLDEAEREIDRTFGSMPAMEAAPPPPPEDDAEE